MKTSSKHRNSTSWGKPKLHDVIEEEEETLEIDVDLTEEDDTETNIEEPAVESTRKMEYVTKKVKRAPFILPVGDVIMWSVYKATDERTPTFKDHSAEGYEHQAETQLWWCPPDNLKELRRVCKVWEDNGFKLHVGTLGEGTEEYPEVIEYEYQQRAPGSEFCMSTKLVEALIGDILVWFEIEDAELAYDILQKKKDIPVAVRCDVYAYSYDVRYRDVFDIANDAFQYFYMNRRPLNLVTKRNEDEDL